MANKAITIGTTRVGKTAKIQRPASVVEEARKGAVRSGEVHPGSAADVLSAFAELYRQL